MTRDEFNATFEVGGTEALWHATRREIDDAEWCARKVRMSDVRGNLDRLNGAMCSLIAVAVVGVGLWGISSAWTANVAQGQRELHDCRVGNTLACQEWVQSTTTTYSDGSERIDPRGLLYKTAYRAATGHDLPPMAK